MTIVTPSLPSAHCAPIRKYRPNGNAHSVFSFKPTAAVPCGPAVTSPRPTMTSTTQTTISSSCLRTLTSRPLSSRACLKLMFYTHLITSQYVFVNSQFSDGRTTEHAAPHGTTWWNHSYYTRIPLSAPHSLQQLQSGASSPPSVKISTSTRESHGAATPSSVSCPQVTHSAISPQVQTVPNRIVTSDFMSATLAEVATQLSFAEFVERCISFSALPTHPHTTSGCRYADYSTQRCLTGSLHPTPARGVLSQMRPPARSLGGFGSTFYPRRSVPHVFPTRHSAAARCGCADAFAECRI